MTKGLIRPMDIVEFLRARLDEDEATARAAIPGPWEASKVYDEAWGIWPVPIMDSDVHEDGTVEETCRVRREEAIHMARHDPARVLREVEAKRRIMDECSWGTNDEMAHGEVILRLLAIPYADHPDYDEAWRPPASVPDGA